MMADRKELLLIIMSMILFSVNSAKSSDMYVDGSFHIRDTQLGGGEASLDDCVEIGCYCCLAGLGLL